jgi:hypothetical protein
VWKCQFGHIGCQEAHHALKRALLLRRQHGIKSYVLLIKAFNTIQHDLIIKILQKYGFTGKLTASIAKLYKNSKVKINVGKSETLVDYTTGVHQGDNTFPVLFLFIMQAFLDTLRIDVQATKFTHFLETKGNISTCKGRLLSQNINAKGKSFNFRCPFYVDDSTFSQSLQAL